MSSMKNYFLNLNLFAPKFDDNEQETDQQRRWNIIGTRVYIFLLMLILCGIGLTLSFINHSIKVTIENPNKEQLKDLPIDAQCMCSQVLIPYGKFTSLNATFHQICSSDFITNRWINAINSGPNSTLFFGFDFRTYGSAQFQALAGFCRLSKAHTDQSIDFFYSNTLLSSELLSENILRLQTNASINQFQSTVSDTFKTQLRLINYMTVNNGLISSLGTNAIYLITINDQNMLGTSFRHLQYSQADGSNCNCRVDICNKTGSGIFDVFNAPTPAYPGSLQFYIPGISAGCLPVTSILVSTLECFYQQMCINRLLSYFPTTEKFYAMSLLNQSLYSPESTIQFIVDSLMIENWTIAISYEKYYAECAPSSCTYLKISSYNLEFIIKKLVSLLASLILILGLIVPLIIRIVLESKDRTPKPKIPLCIRLHRLKELIQKQLMNLNLFRHYPSSDRQICHQRYATRLYLVLIIISVTTLAFYTLLTKTIQTKTIYNPTEFQYNQLYQEYSRSLSCPCASISMLYSHFITIQPQYHQVCSSDLISDRWVDYLNGAVENQYSTAIGDYVANAPNQFQLLSIICEQSQKTIDDALRLFLQTRFFTSQVISKQPFEKQVNSFFQNWKVTTVATFLTTIQLFQADIQGNRVNSDTSFRMRIDPVSGGLEMGALRYSNCACALSAVCHEPASIYKYDRNSETFTNVYSVPNFFMGCFRITSLLASTLECFYNISCMLQIDTHINSTKPFNFSALELESNLVNETIDIIVRKLMVNEWLSNISFTSYYKRCAPLSCIYQYEDRDNLFVIVTTILGIFGGLSLGFRLLILIGLQLTDKVIANGLHRHTLSQTIKYMFVCNTEHQMIHRLHFILVAIILTILLIFSGFTPHVRTVTIDKPTLSTYRELVDKSYNSLQCSCSQISIKHEVFLNITSRYHAICSSDFISSQWISYLYGDIDPLYRYFPDDFLLTATRQFQILVSFCRLSQETVNNALIQLGSSDFIETKLLPLDSLNKRVQKTMVDFQRTMPKIFINTLSLIRETTGANMLLSGLFSNWILTLSSAVIRYTVAFRAQPLKYNECDCGSSSQCVSSSRGMLAGCYARESILKTTMQCFYNQTCIDSSNTFKAINMSTLLLSRFSSNSTIESIVNDLMVEELSTELSYEAYYNACAPLSCTYSYTIKHDVIEIITAVVDLYGGLFIICRLLSILIVKQILRFTQRVHPITG